MQRKYHVCACLMPLSEPTLATPYNNICVHFDELLTNARPEFVSVPVSVSGWCIWTPGASEMMMARSPGVIDIILRGSSESIEEGGATYNCSRGGSGFLETWRESLRGDKHDTPCIVYQLGAILCWRHNLQDSGNLSTNYPMFSIAAMESVHVES